MFLKFIEQSVAARVIDDTPVDDDIHVILQYFVHANPERDAELKLALRFICEHPLVTAVHLLNERIYDDLEIADPKIRQYCLGTRLKFKDVFKYLREHQVRGYYVIINSDICFDDTLANLRRSDLHVAKKMLAPLRYEVLDTFAKGGTTTLDTDACPLFGPRIDSQDAWIFHSDQTIPEKFEKVFNFQFGKPGCDNKMIYLLRILGYDVINDPAFVKTYHIHASQDRNYTAKDRVPPPYAYLGPYGHDMVETAGHYLPPSQVRRFDDVDYENCNRVLREYLERKCIDKHQPPFVIPCVCPENNTVAVLGRLLQMDDGKNVNYSDILGYLETTAFSDAQTAIAFSNTYLPVFDHCELFAGWESYGHQVREMQWSHDVMLEWYTPTKTMIWAQAFEIFHYIYRQPWTLALRGKRILVVSPLADQMRRQNRQKLYDGVDLFPDCEFHFVRDVDPETMPEYDVALVTSNAVCHAIYESGRSAICVGSVLPMYFGILQKEWLRDRPDVVRLFLNKAWTNIL